METEAGYLPRLGESIAYYRKKQNRTRAALAEAAGIDRTYLGRIEKGTVVNVSLSVLRRIAKGLEVSLPQLLAESEMENCDKTEEDRECYIDDELKDVLYPQQFMDFPILSVLDLIMYLPLMDQESLMDMSCRTVGDFGDNSLYILEKLKDCVCAIPEGPAKEYADKMVKSRFDPKEDLSIQKEQYKKLLKVKYRLCQYRRLYLALIKKESNLRNDTNENTESVIVQPEVADSVDIL